MSFSQKNHEDVGGWSDTCGSDVSSPARHTQTTVISTKRLRQHGLRGQLQQTDVEQFTT